MYFVCLLNSFPFERFGILIRNEYRFYLRYLSMEIPFQTSYSRHIIFQSWHNIVCAKFVCTFLCSEIVIQILQRPQMNGLLSQYVAFSHQYKNWNVRRTSDREWIMWFYFVMGLVLVVSIILAVLCFLIHQEHYESSWYKYIMYFLSFRINKLLPFLGGKGGVHGWGITFFVPPYSTHFFSWSFN